MRFSYTRSLSRGTCSHISTWVMRLVEKNPGKSAGKAERRRKQEQWKAKKRRRKWIDRKAAGRVELLRFHGRKLACFV